MGKHLKLSRKQKVFAGVSGAVGLGLTGILATCSPDERIPEETKKFQISEFATEFEPLRIRGDGRQVFRTKVKPGDGASHVAKRFNYLDKEQGDLYEDISWRKGIVNNQGAEIRRFKEGDDAYVVAYKNEVRQESTPKRRQEPPIVEEKKPSQEPKKTEPKKPQQPRQQPIVEEGKIKIVEARGKSEPYAILINNDGRESRHYTDNPNNAFNALRRLGVPACNIYFVTDHNRNASCKDPSLNLSFIGTSGGVRDAFEDLATRIDSNDRLFIYITGHGAENGFFSFTRNNSILTYNDIRGYSDALSPEVTIAMSDLCFGGEITEAFRDSKRKTLAFSNNPNSREGVCNLFSPDFFNMLRYNMADIDGDGLTSIKEGYLVAKLGYEYALERDRHLTSHEKEEVLDGAIEYVTKQGGLRNLTLPIVATGGIQDATLDGRLLVPGQINQRTVEGRVIELNASNYESGVIGSRIPVVVDLYTKWCPNCPRVERQMKQLAPSYAGRVKFIMFDVDQPGAISEVRKYSPEYDGAIPTVLFVNNGNIVRTLRGGAPDARSLSKEIGYAFSRR